MSKLPNDHRAFALCKFCSSSKCHFCDTVFPAFSDGVRSVAGRRVRSLRWNKRANQASPSGVIFLPPGRSGDAWLHQGTSRRFFRLHYWTENLTFMNYFLHFKINIWKLWSCSSKWADKSAVICMKKGWKSQLQQPRNISNCPDQSWLDSAPIFGARSVARYFLKREFLAKVSKKYRNPKNSRESRNREENSTLRR